jgi:hypothetical protein
MTSEFTCYRNAAIELSTGHLSRDSWSAERYTLPESKPPKPQHPKRIRAKPLPPQRTLGGRTKATTRHVEAMMPATRGLYRRIGMHRDDIGRLIVTARCGGVHCAQSAIRKFRADEWVSDGPDGRRCMKCSCADRGKRTAAREHGEAS